MTIALGINFGDFVLLASDSRVTFHDLDEKTLKYEDDHKKIYRTKLGLITGAGSVPLLDAVRDRLELSEEFNEVVSTDTILQVISEARVNYSKIYPLRAAHDIEVTGWIFTYNTIVENKPKLRLAVVHPQTLVYFGVLYY